MMSVQSPNDTHISLGEKLRRVNLQALGLAVGLLALVITLASLVISALALEGNTRVMARVLADNYAERLKLEAQVERQSQLAKEAQRRQQELQEKLDGLAGIERSLTVRPRQQRLPAGKGEGR